MRPLTILLLEDNPADAELAERQLKKGGLDVTITRVMNERAFREQLDRGGYDVILADFYLPDFDGLSALRIAREVAKDIPFIFVSGSIGEERAIQAMCDGASDYILKDRPSRLPSAITGALERKARERERIEMERRLVDSEQRFHFAVQATRDVIWDWDARSDLIVVNEALRIVWGHAYEQMRVDLQWWLDRIHPEDRPRVMDGFGHALEGTEDRWSDEYRFERADGTFGVVFDRGVIIRDADGKATRVIGAMQDVTERHEAERRIRELSRINELVLNHAGDGILAAAADGRLLFANPAAERMLGWSGETIHDVHAALHPDEEDASCQLLENLRANASRASESIFRSRDGQSLEVHYTVSPMIEDGVPAGYVLTFADVSEPKRLHRQLEQANRVTSLGRVAATIAHEFNNVLMGVQPFAEVVRRRATDEKIAKAAEQITASVARGRRVTEEILRFTQPAEPALQRVVLTDWLREILPELQALVGTRVEVVLRNSPRRIVVDADRAQLHQVLSNLVLNARDAIKEHGTVTISLDEQTGESTSGLARICVSDTGAGMTPDILGRIFEPLFTTKRTGTGLGLVVAQQVLVQHHGLLHVESTPGVGTTFQLLLPMSADGSDAATEHEQHGRACVRRVLIIEDESAVSTGLSLLLESEGVAARVIERGDQALDAIEDFRPDAVLLDMSLPDVSGVEVYQRIARVHPSLPVIFSSGHCDASSIDEYVGTGRVAFLRKPYDFDALLHALETITDGAMTSV